MNSIDEWVDQLLHTNERAGVSRKSFLRAAAVGTMSTIAAACSTGKSTGKKGGPAPVSEAPTAGQPSSETVAASPAMKPQNTTNPEQPVKLEQWKAATERQSGPTPTPMPPDKRVGYAIVGLGHLALEELMPAFAQCKKSKVVALVSGNPEKMLKVARQYGISEKSCYSYATYDRLKDNPEVQVIYIVLPNSMHAEYTIRGAKAGKHILCEKPMANSAAECQAMIDACRKANRKLMVAYRIQYEPYNRLVRDMVRSNQFGKTKTIETVNVQNSDNPAHWRFKKKLAGGGALPDIGLYCLNTIRYLTGEEPTEVFAYQSSTPGDPRFKEVEEMVSWQMRFPSGIITNCLTHYGVHETRRYRVMAERGWIGLDPAFSYSGLKMDVAFAEKKAERRENVSLPDVNQFAAEIDHMSECVLTDRVPFTPGEEGLQDQRIMEAIYKSAKTGRPVKVPSAVKATRGRTASVATNKLDQFRGPLPKNE
ncbi:Gfo/Idh/MocA family oxidoreductase [Fibrella sp. HMF5335]|uniref:Gfo/Idh/MocA family oxidoreductase n=1 Tax=Fibrella rubiginis TaxID=2817060 RepID=A0A939GGA5_9BACT|nr:Gfo/Idh/MocA family oxidoreductase [Fibrella rubiginis]MBO0936950.1 Gfo/Idh/MocA family oxidoreductase [Fibrella rubiginis]